MGEFKQYRRTELAELRPYVDGEKLLGVNISFEDRKAGSPKPGDMIARNPKNHLDQWLVAAEYFADNFKPEGPSKRPEQLPLIASTVVAGSAVPTAEQNAIVSESMMTILQAFNDAPHELHDTIMVSFICTVLMHQPDPRVAYDDVMQIVGEGIEEFMTLRERRH